MKKQTSAKKDFQAWNAVRKAIFNLLRDGKARSTEEVREQIKVREDDMTAAGGTCRVYNCLKDQRNAGWLERPNGGKWTFRRNLTIAEAMACALSSKKSRMTIREMVADIEQFDPNFFSADDPYDACKQVLNKTRAGDYFVKHERSVGDNQFSLKKFPPPFGLEEDTDDAPEPTSKSDQQIQAQAELIDLLKEEIADLTDKLQRAEVSAKSSKEWSERFKEERDEARAELQALKSSVNAIKTN